MRVMCINDKWFLGGIREKPRPGPKYGDICEVVEEKTLYGELMYVLAEWRGGEYEDGFTAECFIPLSDEPEVVETEADRFLID
jgi:hypothetical protein